MVNKTTSFKKKGKGKKGNFNKNSKQVSTPGKKPKSGPKPETECFYCKRNCLKYLADKKDGKVNKGLCDIHVIDVYLTNACPMSVEARRAYRYFLTFTHYCRLLLTRQYDQRPLDETVCDAIIANGGVK